MKVTMTPVVIGALGTILQRLGKRARRVGNRKTSRDQPNYSIIKIDQNTEKSSGDLRIFDVIQNPVKYHQLSLMRETRKE